MITIDSDKLDGCIFGIPGFKKNHRFRRLTDEIVEAYPQLIDGDRRCAGGRLRFRTDSTRFEITIRVSNLYPDRGMSYYQANVANVFIGDGPSAVYGGIVTADDLYNTEYISGTFYKSDKKENITVYLPRNPTVEDITVKIEDDAEFSAPLPYSISKPFVFYGSSITENGHTSSSNGYPVLVSRWLDADFLNLGISGMAKGEKKMAEYAASFDAGIFIYDYDHNAPSPDYLEKTHEKFFKIYRSFRPDTTVIMMSRPSADSGAEDTEKRKKVILNTYNNAVKSGDKNVYFIDGMTFFDVFDREVCTTDRTHPNDLGHYLMAVRVADLIKKILCK